MTKQHFSFKEIFMFGWAKTKQHAWFVALTFIIMGVIVSATDRTHFLNIVVSILAGLSLASISMRIARNEHFTFADLFNPLLSSKRVLKFAAVTILYFIGTVLGLVPIVVGIYLTSAMGTIFGAIIFAAYLYFAVCLKFYPYVVIENEDLSVKDLIKMTYRLTSPYFGKVFMFLVLAGIFNLIGAMIMLVGLIVTIPVTLFASIQMYDKIKGHTA